MWLVRRGPALALLALALCAGSTDAAVAQLPLLPPIGQPPSNPPPSGGPPSSPSPPRPTPLTGGVVSYHQNPARTGASSSEAVAGPLYRAWTKRFKGPVNQPLIVDGRVIANIANSDGTGYGSHVDAFSRFTGRLLWRRSTPGGYFSAHIAADSGTVVSANYEGTVRAFAVSDGRPRWTTVLGNDERVGIPVARGGIVFVPANGSTYPDSTIYALSVADGRLLWKRTVAFDADRQMPALDGERIFLTGGCGSAIALSQRTGAVVWSHSPRDCFEGPRLVHQGRLFVAADTGTQIYDAANGSNGGAHPFPTPAAVAGSLGFVAGDTARAYSLVSGRNIWQRRTGSPYPEDLRVDPIVVGPTLYTKDGSGRLVGLDRRSGRLLSRSRLPEGSASSVGGIHGGISAGSGVLAVTNGVTLSAFRSVLNPRAGGLDIAASAFDIAWGKRVAIVAGLGKSLRRYRRKVLLDADSFPFRRFHKAASARAERDGAAYFRLLRPGSNTRFRARLPRSRKRSISFRVYVYPRFGVRVRQTSRSGGLARVTLRAGRAVRRLAGRRLFLYYGRRGRRTLRRLGAARLHHAGRGRVATRIRIRLPRRAGFASYCVRSMSRGGFGRHDAFERRCGRRHLRE